MIKLAYISIGGAIGALLRYGVSGIAQRFSNSEFPLGTLAVNLTGSSIIGVFWVISESVMISQNFRIFIFIGILGSFTTFSTFTLESFHLLRDSEYVFFFANILLSITLGITLVFAGYFFSRYIISIMR